MNAAPDSTLRLARDDDAQDLYGLIALCFAEFPGCFVDPHDDMPDLARPATATAAKGGAFFVMEDERGRVCACVSVDYPAAAQAELHRLYVRPDKRRLGLGERLVKLVEEQAAGSGATSVVFWSDTRFNGAHRLYERLGYVRGPTRDLGDVSNSVEYFYRKTLGPA
jgi:putative acetyltransferase